MICTSSLLCKQGFFKIHFAVFFFSIEPWDNDAKINEKGTFKNDDQEQNTNSHESYSTERDCTSGKQNKQ